MARVPGPASRLRRLPIRVRLVAGFSAAMLVVLAAAGAFVYWRVDYALNRGLDTELDQASVTIAATVAPGPSLPSTAAAEDTGVAWQLLDRDGAVVAHGGPAPDRALLGVGRLRDVGATALVVDVGRLLPAAAAPVRVHVTRLPGADGFLVVAVRSDHRDEALRELLGQLSLAGLVALVATALVGYRLARAALVPVERYRRQASEIAQGATGVRLDVPEHRQDEVTRLGSTLNQMLAALETSLEDQQRFVHEASHELRTPLTLLTSRVQLARRRTRTVAEHEEVLDRLTADVARLVDLADQLLDLGATSAPGGPTGGATGGPTEPAGADVARVVVDVVARLEDATEAPAPRVELELGAEPSDAPVRVALPTIELDRLVSNLLRNAEIHGRAPFCLRVDVGPGALDWVRVAVADSGEGMSPHLLATATGRFTRAAEARARPGSGLGLSLVRAIVGRAGGELRLCHDGHHVSYGPAVALACPDHRGLMTVTALLPREP